MSAGTRVAKVLDSYSVALNRGSEHGIMAGDIFTITSDDIVDPETGQIIGRYSKLRIKVTEVHPKFCIAQSYRLVYPTKERAVVTVCVGDIAIPWPGEESR